MALEISEFAYMPMATLLKTNQIGGTAWGPYRFFSCEFGRKEVLRGAKERKEEGRLRILYAMYFYSPAVLGLGCWY